MEIERPPSSALIKRLRDASRARPRSLGFGRREDEAAAPPLVLIARVDGLNAQAASQAVAAGAAAVAFALGPDEVSALAAGQTDPVSAAVAACGQAVAGLLFDAVPPGPDLGHQVDSLGVDFAISSVERAPAALLSHESIALVARIDDYGEHPAYLRALGELKVDAILAGPGQPRSGQSALSVFELMAYKLVVDAVRQPVLIVADGAIRPDDLQALRDVGVDGLIVPADALAPYRDAVAKVKITRRASVSADGGALLPRLSRAADASEEGDDDDDDDD